MATLRGKSEPGWPDDFKPREFRCVDRGGYFGDRGSTYRSLPASGPIRERARLLAWELQTVRDKIRRPIRISSAYRPLPYNEKVGSKATSQHPKGRAADIVAFGMTARQLHSTMLELMSDGRLYPGGLGLYVRSKFVHYDIRPPRKSGRKWARWRGN